jgi:hypothetical protein
VLTTAALPPAAVLKPVFCRRKVLNVASVYEELSSFLTSPAVICAYVNLYSPPTVSLIV